MALRTEKRFGVQTLVGTTYVNVYTVSASTTANCIMHVANRTAGTVAFRAFIAASGWSANEPTGGTLVSAVAYDLQIPSNDILQISGIVLQAGEKFVVRADTANSLDVSLFGVEVV